jgi:RNA polymerase sigma-70 factor (ECF subfamily)
VRLGEEVDLSSAGPRFLVFPLSGAKPEDSASNSVTTEQSPRLNGQPADETLMARLRSGDEEALAHLFRRYATLVRGVAVRILKDEAESDDLVQELFLFIYRKAEVFDGTQCTPRSWIVQMTYHRAIDRRRYLEARNHYAHVEFGAVQNRVLRIGDSSFDRALASALDSPRIEKALAALTDDQRQTLRLYFYDGYTIQEIAARLGQPIGNARHHYYRGLDALRKQLIER